MEDFQQCDFCREQHHEDSMGLTAYGAACPECWALVKGSSPMTDAQRIRRLELAVAALADMLADTNPHIECQLLEVAEILDGEHKDTPNDQ